MNIRVFTNLANFPKSLSKLRFKQLQTLCFAKDIGWIDTGMNYEEHMIIPNIFIQFKGEKRNKKDKYIMYSAYGQELSYKELINRLRAL